MRHTAEFRAAQFQRSIPPNLTLARFIELVVFARISGGSTLRGTMVFDLWVSLYLLFSIPVELCRPYM